MKKTSEIYYQGRFYFTNNFLNVKGDVMKEIYLVHVDAYIGSYLPSKHPVISYAPREKFIDFVKSLREDYPDFKPRCVINEGITETIRKKIQADKILMAAKQYCR